MSVKDLLEAVNNKLILDEINIMGKTIASATLCESDETLVLKFTDGTAFIMHATTRFDYTTQDIVTKVDTSDARTYKLITDDEWKRAKAEEEQAKAAELEERERRELARLQRKYQP